MFVAVPDLSILLSMFVVFELISGLLALLSTFAIFVTMPRVSPPLFAYDSVCIVRFFVCVFCIFVPILGSLTPPFISAVYTGVSVDGLSICVYYVYTCIRVVYSSICIFCICSCISVVRFSFYVCYVSVTMPGLLVFPSIFAVCVCAWIFCISVYVYYVYAYV